MIVQMLTEKGGVSCGSFRHSWTVTGCTIFQSHAEQRPLIFAADWKLSIKAMIPVALLTDTRRTQGEVTRRGVRLEGFVVHTSLFGSMIPGRICGQHYCVESSRTPLLRPRWRESMPDPCHPCEALQMS
jgi:hypothetical protein